MGGRVTDIIQTMYKKVVRTILVIGERTGDFEVQAGVPQGAVLSPFLYAMYIDGLRQKGLGVRIAGRLVPLLLYADDVVLLARTSEEMKAMHGVLEQYARQWRFEINHGKSNIVVAGSTGVVRDRRMVDEQEWLLCGAKITRVLEYKYLGAEVGANRGRWNTMLQRMWVKAKAASNLTMWQGGGADGLRPRAFMQLWTSKIRPTLEYGSELWEGDRVSQVWVDKLEAVQYNWGKAVLKIKGNVAAVAVRAELGLQSLRSRRKQRKLNYWRKLCTLDESRLLAVVFRERHAEVCAGRGKESCLQAFKHVLEEHGLGEHWTERTECTQRDVMTAVEMAEGRAVDAEMLARSSLGVYRQLQHTAGDGIPMYLDDWSNREGVRLMSKCRLGHLMTMKRVARIMNWPRMGSVCVLCDTGQIEDVAHLVQYCPTMAPCRERMIFELERRLAVAGETGRQILRQVRAGGEEQLRVLLGGEDSDAGGDEATQDARAYATWVTDKTAKSYLRACWRLRTALIGELRVENGVLQSDVSTENATSVLRAQNERARGREGGLREQVEHWRPWVRRSGGSTGSRRVARTRHRSAFYVVWRGRQEGLFYKWPDCMRSVANFAGAKFKGFRTLREAEDGLRMGG